MKKSGKISKKSKSTKPAEEEVVVEDSAQKENKRKLINSPAFFDKVTVYQINIRANKG